MDWRPTPELNLPSSNKPLLAVTWGRHVRFVKAFIGSVDPESTSTFTVASIFRSTPEMASLIAVRLEIIFVLFLVYLELTLLAHGFAMSRVCVLRRYASIHVFFFFFFFFFYVYTLKKPRNP